MTDENTEDLVCPLYKFSTLRIPGSRQIGGTKPDQFVDCPWCSHPSSPVSEKIATTALGGAKALKCKGNWPHDCPIKEQARKSFEDGSFGDYV